MNIVGPTSKFNILQTACIYTQVHEIEAVLKKKRNIPVIPTSLAVRFLDFLLELLEGKEDF